MFISVMKTFAAVSGCPCSPVTRPVMTACCASALPDDSASAAAIANDRRLLLGRSTVLIGPLTREKYPTANQTPPTSTDHAWCCQRNCKRRFVAPESTSFGPTMTETGTARAPRLDSRGTDKRQIAAERFVTRY